MYSIGLEYAPKYLNSKQLSRNHELLIYDKISSTEQEIVTASESKGLESIIPGALQKFKNNTYANISTKFSSNVKQLGQGKLELLGEIVLNMHYKYIEKTVTNQLPLETSNALKNLYSQRQKQFDKLTLSCTRLLIKYFMKYSHSRDPGAVLQEGAIGLMQAAYKWDAKTRFSYFSGIYMNVKMRDELIRQKTNHNLSANQSKKVLNIVPKYVSGDSGVMPHFSVLNSKDCPERNVIRMQISELLNKSLKKLKTRNAVTIVQTYAYDHTLAEVGHSLNISRARVGQLRQRAKKDLEQMPDVQTARTFITEP